MLDEPVIELNAAVTPWRDAAVRALNKLCSDRRAAQRAWRSDDAAGLLGRVGPLVAREVTGTLTSPLAPTR